MLKEFKEFALKGNVVDLAVGLIIGSAFGKIISSFVVDVIMPPIGLLLGRINFSDLYLNLSGTPYSTFSEAQAAGAPTINYGLFLNNVVDFIIVALVLFFLIRSINKLRVQPQPAAPNTKECPFCFSNIPIKAMKCPQCTSNLTN